MALAQLTSVAALFRLFALLDAVTVASVLHAVNVTVTTQVTTPFRYDDAWRSCPASNHGTALYRDRTLLVSRCLWPGTQRDSAACCRARHQPVIIIFSCSRNDRGTRWSWGKSAQHGLTVVYPKPPPGMRTVWGGSPTEPFTAAQKAAVQRIVHGWLAGPDGERVLLMGLCEWQSNWLRELLPAEERQRVLSPPAAAFQAFEGAETGKAGTGPWLRANGFGPHAPVEYASPEDIPAYPALAKPSRGEFSRGVTKVNSLAEVCLGLGGHSSLAAHTQRGQSNISFSYCDCVVSGYSRLWL